MDKKLLRIRTLGLWVGWLGVCALFAGTTPAQDTAKPAKPDSIFDDSDTGAAKPKESKPSTPPAKTSPTEPTTPPATEPPRAAAPPTPSVPPKPAPKSDAPPAKSPVPPQADIDKALKLVKDVFADDYKKKTAKDRVALAERLLKQANEPGNDAASRYAMLREARDVAAGAGDVSIALSAVDAIAQSFVVNAVDLKTEVLTAAAKKPADANAAAAVAGGFVELAEEALAEADVDHATKLLAQAESAAKKAKDSDLTANITKRKKELRDAVAQFGALGPMREKLKKSPDDPAANLALGKFYCFAAGNWDAGLPMLAKGSDAILQKLARDDLASADKSDAHAEAAIGDGWFDLSEKPNAAGKSQLRARAAHWYEKCLPSLAGLERTRVEKRVASIQSDAPSGTAVGAGGATPADKGMRMLEAVVAKIPADSRAKSGRAMDTYRVGRMLTGQLFKTPFDAELIVSRIETMSFDGRESTYASFQSFGPLSLEGASYTLRIIIDTRKQISAADMEKLTPGTHVKVRAIIKDVDVIRYYSTSDREGTNEYQFRVTLANPTITLAAGRAAAGASKANGASAAKPNSAAAIMEAVANGMPSQLKPKPGADWVSAPAIRWVGDNFSNVSMDDVLTMAAVNITTAAGGQRGTISFVDVGPFNYGGLEYMMQLRITGSGPRNVEFTQKYKPGDVRRARGTLGKLALTDWVRKGGSITRLIFQAEFNDVQLDRVPAAPAAAAAPK